MLYLGVSGIESVEVEKEKVLVFYFFADGYMLSIRRDVHTLYILDGVREFDELHNLGIEGEFSDGLPYSEDYFKFGLFFFVGGLVDDGYFVAVG